VRWQRTKGLVEDLRVIKNETELEDIRKAAKITDCAFDFIKGKIKKGASEKELALELEYFLKKNADEAAFPPIVAFGKNAAIPHYLPTNNQQLTTNNLILLDFGAKIHGYCSDMTRVVFFGEPSSKHKLVYKIVLAAQEEVLKTLNKYTAISGMKLDKIARQFIKKHHFPPYPHGLGHGVGLSIHEDPRLKIASKHILRPGMVFTIEPAIYLKGWGGIRIEDLLVIKEKGVEILSRSTKSLVVL
jgi:Xaa-Pro aminopeptidase